MNNYQVFRYFNWGSGDFKLSVSIVSGAVQVYMNSYSDTQYTTNGYLAIPINGNNSIWQQANVSPNTITQRIVKGDPVLGCSYCWYYFTVKTNLTNAVTQFSIMVSPVPDGGETVPQILLGQQNQLTLPATGTTLQRKFILDNKSPFTVEVDVSLGNVTVYVGANPGQALTAPWSATGGAGGSAIITVPTTDINFQLGIMYYVIMTSTNGKVNMVLTLSQQRTCTQLKTSVPYKDLYQTAEQRVLFYYF